MFDSAGIVMYLLKRITFILSFGWMLFISQMGIAVGSTEKVEQTRLKLYVVFNNIPYKARLKSNWGFACLIEGLDKTILFDTGGNGDILLSNMQRLGLDPKDVDAVILSHIHRDHTGGLDTFLARNPDVSVYMPESFPVSFQKKVLRLEASTETVTEPQKLFDSVYSTGEMGKTVKEQALIIDTQQGLIVITGCAHPNVADMAERAQTYLGKKIYLLMGGFHLLNKNDAEVRAIIKRLKMLGVKKVAPSHCTGNNAISMFRGQWKDDFIESGLGAVIEVLR